MSTLPSSSRFQGAAGALAVVAAAALVAVWSVFFYPWTRSDGASAPSPPTLLPATPQLIVPLVSKDEFYRRELKPLLEKAKATNRASADKALDRLHLEFDRFRTGIPGFVNDVSSWRTRFGILRRLSRDKWTNFWKAENDAESEEVKNYMLGKFEYHILAQDDLQKAVGSSLSEFRDDVAATRN